MRKAIARGTRFLLAIGVGASAVSCGVTSPSDTVTIMIPWARGTGEYNAFAAVVSKFENDNRDVEVNLEVTRAVAQQLDADLAAHDPPDLVDLPSPAAVKQYEGKGLRPLGISLSSYDQPWRGLAESAAGTVYAIPVKADVKSLIWYRIGVSPPASWQALESISSRGSPWCLGLASGAASGWPGADWIADILLSGHGAGTYESWLGGTLPWTSPAIEDAWQTWGSLMRDGAAIGGGAAAALKTPFDSAMTARCELEHGALSATGLTSTRRYRYVRFPDRSRAAAPILVSGDFMGLFTGNQNARKLLSFLASDKAQALWVRQPGGYAMSADSAVRPAAYLSKVQRTIAGLLQPAAGTELCFGALDMMLPDVSVAFSQAVLDYVNDHNSLATLLRGLQQTQRGTGQSPVASRACARP